MQTQTKEGKGNHPLSFLSTDLGIFRSISLLLALLLPLYWLFSNHDQSVITGLWAEKDPLGERLILSGIYLSLVLLSYLFPAIRRSAFLLSIFNLYLLTAWSLHLLALNNFEQGPLISLIMIGVVTGLLFRKLRQLIFFIIFSMLGAVVAFVIAKADPYRLLTLLVVQSLTFLGIFFWLRQRLNVQKSLAKNENLLRSILSFSAEFILLVDGETGSITNCNDHFPSFFEGFSKELLVEKRLGDAIPSLFSNELVTRIQDALVGGTDFQDEIQFTMDDSTHWVALSARKGPIEDSNLWMLRLSDISSAKASEASLRFSDMILKNLDTLVLAADHEGKIIFVGPASKQILGHEPEKLLGNGWWKVRGTTEEETEREKQYLMDCASRKREPDQELYEREVLDSDGNKRWILWKDALTPQGTVIGLGQDITSLRKEEAMREVIYNITSASIESNSLKDLYAFVHAEIEKAIPNSNFYISLLSEDGKRMNFPYYVDHPTSGEVRSFSRELTDGLSEYCIRHQKSLLLRRKEYMEMVDSGEISLIGDLPKVWMGVPLVFEGESFGVLAVQDYDSESSYRQADLDFLKLISNQIALAVRKKQFEEALQRSEKEFRGIFDQASVGIAKMLPDGSFAEVNERLCQILGRDAAELKSTNLFELMLEQEIGDSQEAFRRIISGSFESLSIQKRYRHKRGSILHLHLYGSLVRESDGSPKHLIAVFDDVTEQKRTETETSLAREITIDVWSSENEQKGIEVVLQKVCEHIGWDLAEYWMVTEDGFRLCHAKYMPLDIYEAFYNESQNRNQNGIDGFPAAISESGEWLWLSDLPNNPLFKLRGDLAEYYNFLTALAIPVLAGEDLMGIIVLYRSQEVPQEDRIVRFVSRVTPQLSSFIIHKQAESARQAAAIDAGRAQLLSVLQTTFESSPDGVLVVDNQEGVINFNEKLLEMWQASPEEIRILPHEPGFEKLAERLKDPNSYLESIKTLEEHPDLPSYDLFEFKDGRIIERFSRPFSQEDSGVSGRVWFFHDITDRTQAEKALRENERKYRSLFSQANDAILLIENGRISDCNTKTASMFGIQEADLLGHGVEHFSPKYQPGGEISEKVLKTRIEAAANGEPQFFQWQYLRNNGAPFDAEVSMNALQIDGNAFVQVMIRDISERLKAERALRDSEAQNKAILNAIPDLMLILSREGYVLDLKQKPGLELFTGQSQMINQKIHEILPSELVKETLRHVEITLQSGEMVNFEYELENRHFEMRLVPSGQEEVLAILRNITEKKLAENELIQRNFELDSFVYRASHDLKAPLNSIMGLIELLRMETDAPEVVSYLSLMDRSVTKLDSFIRDLADFSRNERMELKLDKIDFESIVSEVFENLSFMKNAERLKKETHFQLDSPVYSDPVRMGIIFNNLISNTVKYQDLAKEDAFVKVYIHGSREKVEIRIEDNGLGIKEEYQDRVFNMFFRASNQSFGTGLGMYIAKNAVEKMKGTIRLESKPGTGTTFIVEIPNLGEPPALPEAALGSSSSR